MQKKVLVIDDSALMRRVISDIISKDEQFTVAGVAKNGDEAMDLIHQKKTYDVIIVDINMPKKNGVQFLMELNQEQICIPAVVVSSLASKSAKETIQALEIGAFDFIRKPDSPREREISRFQKKLFSCLYLACALGEYEKESEKESVPDNKQIAFFKGKGQRRLPSRTGEKLVVIASSTGWPKALQSVIPRFPENFPYPIVVVQHMPAGFTASLAERLDEMSCLTVKEAEDGEELKSGCVYIAKGGRQCELVQQKTGKYLISETNKPARGGLRPCADVFFESLVDTAFDEIICGVLTGMGSDASKGISRVKGFKEVKVVAQSESTCVVYGMPRAAKMAGVVDDMVPLEEVASAMMKKIGV